MGKIEWGGESTAAVAVSDYGRSLAWYRDVLGFEARLRARGYGWAQLRSPVDGMLVGIGQSEEVKEGGGATLTFTVRDIAAARGYLEGEGVRFDADARGAARRAPLVVSEPRLEPHTIVLLRRPADAPDLPEPELDRLQAAHLAHLAELRDRGLLAVAGPFTAQEDESLRGLCLFRCSVEEARAAMAKDPSVRARRLYADVFTWLTVPGTLGPLEPSK